MKFRPGVPAAYAPAQAATAVDAAGRPVALLFVPQWSEVVRQVAAAGGGPGAEADAETQWAFSQEIGLLLLFIRFAGGREAAVTFSPAGSRALLGWWEEQGRVDLVLAAAALQEVELPALGFARADPTTPAYVRIRDVPFLTA